MNNATVRGCWILCRNWSATARALQHFSRELSRYWRNLLVAKISGKLTALIAASDQEQNRFA